MAELLGLPHIIAVVIIVILCIACSVLYRKLSEMAQNRAGLCVGILLAVLDIIHYFVFDALGELSVNAIPLHLCALAVYVCLFHSIFKTDFAGQVLYDLCLPGAWCAILFPDWIGYPPLGYPSLHSYAVHGLIVIYITAQLAAGRIRPRFKAIWKPVVFLCVAVPVAAMVNRALGTNFMFISHASAGSPLEWLWQLAGGVHAIYLVLYGLLALIVMTLMYAPYEVIVCRNIWHK